MMSKYSPRIIISLLFSLVYCVELRYYNEQQWNLSVGGLAHLESKTYKQADFYKDNISVIIHKFGIGLRNLKYIVYHVRPQYH